MFWKSKGIGRALSILLGAVALVPALQPYQELIMYVASSLGIASVANAALK